MTSFLSPSRALPYQLASRTSLLGAGRGSRVKSWSRVTFKNQNVGHLSSLLQLNASTPIFKQLLTRFYATNPGKPKAHTGRVAASKRKPAAARSDAAAGVPKKAPAKKRTTRKKSAAKKPASKTKSRVKAKSKAKAKPKRKAVTTAQKAAKLKKDASQKRRNLRQQALLNPPKRLPSTAYTVLFTESSGKGIRITEHAKAISTQYKSLSPEEMERLNRVANENKAMNDVAFKKWLGQHTPAEIKAANAARNQLKRQAKKDGSKRSFTQIKDERIVKQARSSYTYFLTDRFSSGDMKNMKLGEVGALIGREWKALNAAEKKPYEDRAVRDKARYIDEYTTVYGEAPHYAKKKST